MYEQKVTRTKVVRFQDEEIASSMNENSTSDGDRIIKIETEGEYENDASLYENSPIQKNHNEVLYPLRLSQTIDESEFGFEI